VGAVHAGWKGLQAGVIEEAANTMRKLGATHIHAALGPCIHVECYEFATTELDGLAQQFGDDVIGETSHGTPALDMVAAVKAACIVADVELTYVHDDCTACATDTKYFSYRARQDAGRQVMVVWRTGEQ
jgi:copper oxidase (laccase) domain-containing protein